MSTGTNKERLEQNNTLLEDIKTQIQKLPEAGSSGGIKQFATVEEMQADPTSKEGDLAVVYRSEVQNATVDSHFQTATFPDTVVLDTAITDYVEVRYRAVDSSKMFDCWGSLDSSRFRMNCYTETGEIRIQYTSSDGITYTRTDTTGNPIDFGTEIYYEMAEMWNDAIGKFIQVGGSTFEGLYKYSEYTEPLIVKLSKTSGLSYNPDTNEISTGESILVDINKILSIVKDKISMTDFSIFSLDETNTKFGIFYQTSGNSKQVGHSECYYATEQEVYVVTSVNFDTYAHHLITIDTINLTFVDEELSIVSTERFNVPVYSLGVRISIDNENVRLSNNTIYVYTSKSEENPVLYRDMPIEHYSYCKYLLAPTQLTATSEYVYGKEFYGQNGVAVGTLQNKENLTVDEVINKVDIWTDYNTGVMCPKDMNSAFSSKSYTTIPLLDTSNVTNMYRMFRGCTSLKTIPLLDTGSVTNMASMFNGCTTFTSMPLLDTSNVTSMSDMFSECISLTTIPLLDTSNVTSMGGMFSYCSKLTSIPLLDTSSVTTMSYMFQSCPKLTTIPLLDTSNVTNMDGMFNGCTVLTSIPELNTSNVTNTHYMFNSCSNLTAIPLLNTSNVTNMGGMFQSCSKLTTIPLLDTSKVTSMVDMFYYSRNLSDESLNNILAMCANATSYTKTKTLAYIGLTSAQANKCKSLSNYSAFTNAGWITGY